MPRRLPRWSVLLALPLLVGALLLMHGLDAGGTGGHTGVGSAAPHDHEGHRDADHAEGVCGDCLAGHLLAACVAVLAGALTASLVRRAGRDGWPAVGPPAAPGRARVFGRLLRPPGPVWVRLAVMRC